MRTTILIALLLVIPASQANTADEKTLLGDWCAGAKTDYFENFNLAIEDGEHQFNSWLHNRPGDSGTWALNNQSLTITDDAGDQMVYAVEKATPQELKLQAKAEAPEIYVRSNCIRLEQPPSE